MVGNMNLMKMKQRNTKKNDEVLDLVGSFPKYEFYKKKYGRGYNFDFKLTITPETRGDEPPQLNHSGIADWWELRGTYKVSRVDLVKLIENKSIHYRYKDPYSDTKIFAGKINFVDREPTEEEWNKRVQENEKGNKKTNRILLIVGVIILITIMYFKK